MGTLLSILDCSYIFLVVKVYILLDETEGSGRRGEGERGRGRGGDGEMGRWGDGEMGM